MPVIALPRMRPYGSGTRAKVSTLPGHMVTRLRSGLLTWTSYVPSYVETTCAFAAMREIGYSSLAALPPKHSIRIREWYSVFWQLLRFRSETISAVRVGGRQSRVHARAGRREEESTHETSCRCL